MKLFGSTFASVRLLGTTTATLIALLIYLTIRRVSGPGGIAVALALLFAVRMPHDVNHHTLTTAASMAAALALLGSINGARLVVPRCFAAGIFAGLAAMTTQDWVVVLAGRMIAVFLGL